MLGGLKMDAGCETKMHITSPKPFAEISHGIMVHALSATKSSKKKVKDERHLNKIGNYRRHHKSKQEDTESFFSNTCITEIRESKDLCKKFQETKAKKNKKEKLDKNNKKNDVLPVTTINDENRTAVYQRTDSGAPLGPHAVVNGNISPPSAINIKPADLFRGNSTPNSHNFPDGAQTLAIGANDNFNVLYGADGNFPDFLEAGPLLDDLLSTGNDLPADPGDINSILDHLQETLPDSFREHVRAFEAQSPQIPYDNAVKNENFASPHEMNGFLSPESRGSNSTPNSAYSPRSTMAPTVMNGPNAMQRVTPDNLRPGVDSKRFLPSQADKAPLPPFPGMRCNLPTQASDRTYNPHQKPLSPFAPMHDFSARLDPQKPSGPVMNAPHGNGSFPMVQQQQQTMQQQQSSVEMYNNAHAYVRPVGQPMQQQPMVFDNMQHMQAPRHVMRANQPAPAVTNNRYYPADVPGPGQFQQAQNISPNPVTYNNHMNDGGGMVYNPNPQATSYGQNVQPGYNGPMMANRLPSVQQYAAAPSIRAPQYRNAMPPASGQTTVGGRMYMNPTGSGSGGPYANHMQNPSVYPANIEQQPSMRHMTGYRPPYGPVKTSLVQQPQQQHYAPSTNMNVPQQQQAPQHRQQQSAGFYPMQNGGFMPDQQGFVHNHPGDPYAGSWTS
ncbi:uncharacterized protein LOC129589301 [Paramacrobiotus metropolitanus]|uniref:uncharacterized protein LOC129589301 n=1 Tax=Paramacrobiotus metropolitanus TaxID=2943436 RepID=UPI0024460852|nr:uncharacterized protein LOC129589301 [Paramacrobiotus metropolitanus]